MKYQLVLQWPATSIKDFDDLIEVENILEENLSTSSEVDGHDAGSGEMNIFILTDDPAGTFVEVERALSGNGMWADARVAYRELDGEEFSVLKPKNLTDFKVA